MRVEENRYSQHNLRKAARMVILVHLLALLLVGNAAFVCRAAGETVLKCVMEGVDEEGNLGMRIEVSADPDVEAYDLDVLYDMRSVKVDSVEERCGQPKAFEYKDYDRDGILRVVGLVGEVIVGEKTLLHISWKPASEEDVNYVPTLAVRDLVDEAGEDIPFTIVYEDAGGSAVTPSPAKLNAASAGDGNMNVALVEDGDTNSAFPEDGDANSASPEDGDTNGASREDWDTNGGTLVSQEEKEGLAGPDTGMQQDAEDEEREDVDQTPSEAGQNGVSGSGNEASGENKKSNEGSESVGESGTENLSGDSSVAGASGADEKSALKKAGGLKIAGENGKAAEKKEAGGADGIAGRVIFIGIAAALVLGGLYYNRRKRT